MRKNVQRTQGFTLVELLVVIALIGIVSTLVIVMLGSSQQEAAETANIANLERLVSAIQTYRAMNGNRLPDRFDSLIRSDADTGLAADQSIQIGFNTQDFLYTGSALTKVLYSGTDVDDDGVADAGAKLLGLHPHNTTGFGNSLAVARLLPSDVDALREVGITTVYDIDPSRDAFHGNPYYIERTLAAGDYVAIVNPMAARNGQGVYRSFGVDLSNTDTYPRAATGDLNDAGIAAALQAKRFFVFGIGPNTTWVGNQRSGLQQAPECHIVSDGYYDRYFLVVGMPGGPNDATPPYPAGILDATGKTPEGAASWASRTQ
jgi:prepilin-type N-terminal cleavage/methylation domain-containing protein